jgi:hypothetical protein
MADRLEIKVNRQTTMVTTDKTAGFRASRSARGRLEQAAINTPNEKKPRAGPGPIREDGSLLPREVTSMLVRTGQRAEIEGLDKFPLRSVLRAVLGKCGCSFTRAR